ncbi:hypothetical protein ACFOD9_02455 [Novosphingobium bradum]|uniref:Uncharacterized protein n=1 Tax=Novosphingobium bradum TaxID=1737444 RepID=A0ABV7IQG0_9SPHN
MDLNELLFQHQRAIRDAGRIAPGPGPSSFDLVGHYAERVRRLRQRLGVSVQPEWLVLSPAAM